MKISLVTVTFNSAKTLCDTIHSVLSQSYTIIEYIIVDGLSNDETVTLIKEYEPLFQRSFEMDRVGKTRDSMMLYE